MNISVAVRGQKTLPGQKSSVTMDNSLYSYSPIVGRPKLVWPEGARVTFYIGLFVEHFEIDRPATSIRSGTATTQAKELPHRA
jgi:hypothetical protein